MKIGFSILSHKPIDFVYQELLQYLIRIPNAEIAIHHDYSQSSIDFSSFDSNSIWVQSDYIKTNWSHINNVVAIQKNFDYLYGKGCDWVVTLSANCFPTVPIDDLLRFFQKATSNAFMEVNAVDEDVLPYYVFFRKAIFYKSIFSIPYWNTSGKRKLKHIRVQRENVPFSDSYRPYHGSDWFFIDRACLDYISKNLSDWNVLVEFFRKVNTDSGFNICPSEVIYHTLLKNNPDLSIDTRYYRYIDWSESENYHPKILTEKDFNAIQTADCLFARKFVSPESNQILNQIKNEL